MSAVLYLSLAVFAAAPAPAAVAIGKRVGVSPERERAILALLNGRLSAAGLSTERADAKCDGNLDCALTWAKTHGSKAALVVTLGAAGADVIVDVEAYDTAELTSLGHLTFPVAPQSLDPASANDLDALAKKALALEPAPATVTAEPARGTRWAPWAVMGAGAVALISAAAFGGVGVDEKARLDGSVTQGMSSFTMSQAVSLRDSANAHFTASLVLGLCAIALVLGGAAWLLLFE